VRLVTWNCCGKFDVNLHHLLDLDVDVAVVCEARAPASWPATRDGRTVTGLGRRVWTESWKELAVVATEPWTLAPHEHAESAPAWTLPVRVSGPKSFTLVALWPVVYSGTPSYVAQIDRAVDWIEQFSAGGTTVLAGDFNAPIASSQAQYDRVERRLNALGLVDAYRVSRDLALGERPIEATYYQHRQSDRPFHLDHLFLPAEWADGAKVEVGDFDAWVASGHSDHVPVVVDLAGPQPDER
jgi:endonuclease/exonuclease/phosphatase (EEP) superfamily protein YafD